jgi:PleD family two-component response regulator
MTLPGKVLIVEDMVVQAMRLQQVLAAAGVATTKVVKSGHEALALVGEDQSWDVIISDVNMPEMDGFELCKQLKMHPQAKQIPVLLLVSLKDASEPLKAMQVGADNFLVKEYEREYFIPQLTAALENARATDSSPSEAFNVYFNGNWHQINRSAPQVAAMMLAAFSMAMREKSARHREPAASKP